MYSLPDTVKWWNFSRSDQKTYLDPIIRSEKKLIFFVQCKLKYQNAVLCTSKSQWPGVYCNIWYSSCQVWNAVQFYSYTSFTCILFYFFPSIDLIFCMIFYFYDTCFSNVSLISVAVFVCFLSYTWWYVLSSLGVLT